MTPQWAKAVRIVILLLTVLGLYAYLWDKWVNMMLDSTKTPAKQLLDTTLQRGKTSIYDLLKYPVLVADTTCKRARSVVLYS